MSKLSNQLRLAIVASITLLCGAAVAQQPEPEKKPEQPAAPDVAEKPSADKPPADPRAAERRVEWLVKLPTELGFSAGFDNKPGAVAMSRTGIDLEVDIPVGAMAELDVGFAYEYSRYDFSSSTALAQEAP